MFAMKNLKIFCKNYKLTAFWAFVHQNDTIPKIEVDNNARTRGYYSCTLYWIGPATLDSEMISLISAMQSYGQTKDVLDSET